MSLTPNRIIFGIGGLLKTNNFMRTITALAKTAGVIILLGLSGCVNNSRCDIDKLEPPIVVIGSSKNGGLIVRDFSDSVAEYPYYDIIGRTISFNATLIVNYRPNDTIRINRRIKGSIMQDR